MPNLRHFFRVGGKRDKVLGDVLFVLGVLRNQARALCALAMVSWVVKVLEATRNSVVSGSTRLSASAMCEPSTLDTK